MTYDMTKTQPQIKTAASAAETTARENKCLRAVAGKGMLSEK